MSNQTPNSEEDQIRGLLSELDNNIVSVDRTALEKIRVASRRAVLEKRRASSRSPDQSSGPYARAIAILVSAAALLLIALVIPATGKAEEGPSLGALLEKLNDAPSASMDVELLGRTTRIEFQSPGTVRWTDSEDSYRIADGHQLWQVTKTEHEGASRVDVLDSPLPVEGLSALRLLGLDDVEIPELKNVYSTGTTLYRSLRCRTFETGLRFRDRPAILIAFAGEVDNELKGLQVRTPSGGQVVADVVLNPNSSALVSNTTRLRNSLKDDGRLGQLTENHGLVFLRSFPGHRWTPASAGTPLFAGDQIRIKSVGPNAAVIRLNRGETLTVGPSGQLTLLPDGRVQLQNGDIRVEVPIGMAGKESLEQTAGGPSKPLVVVGRDASEIAVTETEILRIEESGAASVVPIIPPWLKTLDGNLTTESLGELVAQVDGRDVSLSLGFHHVTVDVRNQIARTVIEESFINNTNERLEGVFHFPLPHDASISGFGMWIGGQLVEADVVEKQHARQIYETILREKRDPGLLEWEGGNVFKARVFPIEARSEKKVRITYTQTLPLNNGSFRYSYPLRSDMLQRTPLRDLTIDVTLHSAVPIQTLNSPSHPSSEVQQTRYSGSLHYSARDITPHRDFELLCEFEGQDSDVLALSHVRGDDGYFMVQLSPPSVKEGHWSRSLVGDGTPLDLIFVCDTSLSMDKFARKQQSELLAAMLGSLSEADRVRVACCDADCHWVVSRPTAVDTALRGKCRDALESRRSLGWSNLQTTLRSVLAHADSESQVIYIGDGTVIGQHGDAGVQLLSWLTGLAESREVFRRTRGSLRRTRAPTFHGIAVGNAFDMNVIRAIGRVGQGTSRVVSGAESATSVARQLLFEITRPGLKDLRVGFRNIDVAAVYPSELPNLADGMQHMITGRFRPGSTDEHAEIVVTGRRGDESVEYVARMPLAERSGLVNSLVDDKRSPEAADQNSFIPRLWAKAHMDHLLMEPATPSIQERIVRLSQKYHLMTPYTSLLVLESEADRRRFGVGKSTQMRDGEEFFAEGKRKAEYSLRQKQLVESRAYRQKLHDQFRNQILQLPQSMPYLPGIHSKGLIQPGRSAWDSRRGETVYSVDARHWGFQPAGTRGRLRYDDFYSQELGRSTGRRDLRSVEFDSSVWSAPGLSEGEVPFDTSRYWYDSMGFKSNPIDSDFDVMDHLLVEGFGEPLLRQPLGVHSRPMAGVPITFNVRNSAATRTYGTPYYRFNVDDFGLGGRSLSRRVSSRPPVEPPIFGVSGVIPERTSVEKSVPWPDSLARLFPPVVHARESSRLLQVEAVPGSDWPSEVVQLLHALPRSLNGIGVGVSVVTESSTIHSVQQTATLESRDAIFWTAENGWLSRTETPLGILVRWSLNGSSGSDLPAFQTGRRNRNPSEIRKVDSPITVPASDLSALEFGLSREWSARHVVGKSGEPIVVLTHRRQPWKKRRLTFHPEKRYVVFDEMLLDDRVTSRTEYAEHVPIGKIWVAGRIVRSVIERMSGSLVPQKVTTKRWSVQPVPELNQEMDAMIRPTHSRLLIDGPLPTVNRAREAIQNGTATLNDNLVRMFELIQLSQWNEVFAVLDESFNRPEHEAAAVWVRRILLKQSDRHAELSDVLPDFSPEDIDNLTEWNPQSRDKTERRINRIAMLRMFQPLCEQTQSDREYLTTIQQMCELLEAIDAPTDVQIEFLRLQIEALNTLRRFDSAIEVKKRMADRWPGRYDLASDWLAAVVERGVFADIRSAYAAITKENQPWSADEWKAAYLGQLTWLRSIGEYSAAAKVSRLWSHRCPFDADAWGHVLRSYVEQDNPDELRKLRDEWLARWDGNVLSAKEQARFEAGFNFGLGKLGGLQLAGPEKEVRDQLIKIAIRAASLDRYLPLAQSVFSNQGFAREPDGRDALRGILKRLSVDSEKLAEDEPTERRFIQYFNRLESTFSWLDVSGISGCDEHDQLLTSLRRLLDVSVDRMSSRQLSIVLFTWGAASDEATSKTQSQKWLTAIVERWKQTDVLTERDELSELIHKFESTTFDSDHQLHWYRRFFTECRADQKSDAASRLFSHLLSMPWSEARQTESWDLIGQIVKGHDPASDGVAPDKGRLEYLDSLMRRAGLSRHWATTIVARRVTHQQNLDEGWSERSDSQKKRLSKRFRVEALRAMISVLKERVADAASREAEADPSNGKLLRFSAWLSFCEIGFRTELASADIADGVGEEEKNRLDLELLKSVRVWLPATPATTPDPNANVDSSFDVAAASVQVKVRRWLFGIWLQLAFRMNDTSPEYLDKLLEYVRAGQETDTIAPRAWKAAEFGILVARDQPQALEALLRNWMRQDKPSAPWRRHLGHLLAELDRIEEAVELYETAGKQNLLTASDWKLLSVWQHALNRREAMEASRRQEWLHTAYKSKLRRLQTQLQDWRSHSATRSPTAPADVVRRLEELASDPAISQATIALIMNWYSATHDPLVLKGLAAGVTGRPAGRIFRTLLHSQSLIQSIDQEAGIDSVYSSLAAASRRSMANPALQQQQKRTDYIAHRLLELQVAFHGCHILDQPGPHADRAVRVLRELSDLGHELDDESLTFFLKHLGKTDHRVLRSSRQQLMETILEQQERGGHVRMRIANLLSSLLLQEGEFDRAERLMQTELNSCLSASIAWPESASELLTMLVRRLEKSDRYLEADRLLLRCSQQRPAVDFSGRIWTTRIHALRNGGTTLAGHSSELYVALRDRVRPSVYRPKRTHEFRLAWQRLGQVVDAAKTAKIALTVADVREMEKNAFRLVQRHSQQHSAILRRIAGLLMQHADHRSAAEFLVRHMRAVPIALQWTQPRSVDNALLESLITATYHKVDDQRVAILRDGLEPVREKVEDVLFGVFQQNIAARDKSNASWFGIPEASSYRNGRTRVMKAVRDSATQLGRSSSHLEFLTGFLKREWKDDNVAEIQILSEGLERSVLTRRQKKRLVELLIGNEQYRQAISRLTEMVKQNSEDLNLRLNLMTCYHETDDPVMLQKVFEFVNHELTKPDPNGSLTLVHLAYHCQKCEMWEQSASSFKSFLDRQPIPVTANETMARQWSSFASSLYRANRFRDALDAISTAWVIAGSKPSVRVEIRDILKDILAAAPDPDELTRHIVAQAAETGEESSFLRRAVGRAYLDQERGDLAEEHLRLTIELQPTDDEARRWLVEALDLQDKREEALKSLRDLLERSPRSTSVCRDLVERLQAMGRKKQAERAATSIIESGAEEATHQIQMAECREQMGQPDAAVDHWQRAVDLATEDPNPLFGLAEALVKVRKHDEARKSLETLKNTDWGDRFRNLPRRIWFLERKLRSR